MRAHLLAIFWVSLVGCGQGRPAPTPPLPVVATEQSSTAYVTSLTSPEDQRFEQARLRFANITFDQLAPSLHRAPETGSLGFDPTTARFWPEVSAALQLTDREKQLFASNGFVASDHGMAPRFSRRGHNGTELEAYSMAGMYYAIWTRDLPVFVTTDSILHALHRSYAELLKILETHSFSGMLNDTLAATHGELGKRLATVRDPALLRSLGDVDVYLTVARNLLTGPPQAGIRIHSLTGQDPAVAAILGRIAGEKMVYGEELWGGQRPAIDWSQYRPRGHYARSPDAQQYFRAMMWLGRADTGWVLAPPDPQSQLVVDLEREQLDAALLALLVRDSGSLERLESIRRMLGFLVGPSDELTVPAALGLLRTSRLDKLEELANADARRRLYSTLVSARAGAQRITSQPLHTRLDSSQPVRLPQQFQMFGQRFALDSFVLSRVVFDSIVFEGQKQKRWMPSGLDVMAALGNDEAFGLLEPELRTYHYEPNLLAARSVVDSYDDARWGESLYSRWLGSLRTLDVVPKDDGFPRAMRSRAWQQKQLQTQLASWAELRHDTILYVKQSYGVIACSYPSGYVEPYPQFYAGIKELATRTTSLLKGSNLTDTGTSDARFRLRHLVPAFADKFQRLADVSARLKALAEKELASEPFSAEDTAFLKDVISVPSLGCGAPAYSGWYPSLFLDSEPAAYRPVIADVHTDPQNGRVLQAGVGGASFLVVAVDNGEDRSVYVGPTYSYYEFERPVNARMTDDEWEKRLASEPPARPSWTASFQAPTVQRDIRFMWAPPGHKPAPFERGAPTGGRPPVRRGASR